MNHHPIENDQQYIITYRQRQKFIAALKELHTLTPDPRIHPVLSNAQHESLMSMITELETLLQNYEIKPIVGDILLDQNELISVYQNTKQESCFLVSNRKTVYWMESSKVVELRRAYLQKLAEKETA